MKAQLIATALLLTAALAFVPNASAADSVALQCAKVQTRPDIVITISPSGCYDDTYGVRKAAEDQCNWVANNPALPPILYCDFTL